MTHPLRLGAVWMEYANLDRWATSAASVRGTSLGDESNNPLLLHHELGVVARDAKTLHVLYTVGSFLRRVLDVRRVRTNTNTVEAREYSVGAAGIRQNRWGANLQSTHHVRALPTSLWYASQLGRASTIVYVVCSVSSDPPTPRLAAKHVTRRH